MKKLLLVPLCLAVVMFSSCSKDDNSTEPGGGGGGGLQASATYRVSFSPNFSQANFPTDYPANAAFSGIVVAVHEPGKSVFQVGQAVSDALKVLAETGDNADLVNFLNSQGGDDSTDFLVTSLSPNAGPTETQSVNVTIDPDKTSITVVAAFIPSPDWFTGVSGQSMIATPTTLVTDLEVDIVPLDAGTDSGTTYTAPDEPTVPAGLVSVINGEPFTTGGGPGAALGTVRFERTDL